MVDQRMFVAIVPPAEVIEELEDFLEPRSAVSRTNDRDTMPWVSSEQWHVTLGFMPAVPAAREDELVARLEAVAARTAAFDLRLAGAGAFPDPVSARVLWLAATAMPDPEVLPGLSRVVRAAASTVGASPDGTRFVPHLTLARPRRPVEATRWLRVLDSWAGAVWTVDELELIASHLGEGPRGRPRYESVAVMPLTDIPPSPIPPSS